MMEKSNDFHHLYFHSTPVKPKLHFITFILARGGQLRLEYFIMMIVIHG